MQKTYGYIRVSTREQCEDRQLIAMQQLLIPPKQIYIDHQSGRDFNRPAYRHLIQKLHPDDLLVIKSIDRLGRDYEEIQEQWRVITKDLGVDIMVLDMPLLNTRTGQDDLTGVFISDLVLQILSYVAQTERENTLSRQQEGIAAAKQRGVRFGRPRLSPPSEFEKVYRLWYSKAIASREAGQALGVSQSTFLRWVREKKHK